MSNVEIATEATDALESLIKGSSSFVFVATRVGLWWASLFKTFKAEYFWTLLPFWMKMIKALYGASKSTLICSDNSQSDLAAS